MVYSYLFPCIIKPLLDKMLVNEKNTINKNIRSFNLIENGLYVPFFQKAINWLQLNIRYKQLYIVKYLIL
jgi:hypothetical protein